MQDNAASLDRLQSLLEQLRPSVQHAAQQQVDPESFAALWTQAQEALQASDVMEAVAPWSELVRLQPSEPTCHFGYGLALQRAGEIELAGRHFSYAYALDPTDAACAFRLGECLLALGWTADAHDALLAAQQLCELPHNDPQIREMALSLMQQMN